MSFHISLSLVVYKQAYLHESLYLSILPASVRNNILEKQLLSLSNQLKVSME